MATRDAAGAGAARAGCCRRTGQRQRRQGGTMAAELRQRIRTIARRLDGTMGVYVHALASGETVEINADRSFQMASVFKVPILAELACQAVAGTLSLDERVELTEEMKAPGSGVLKELSAGTSLTVRDLAMLMIIVSDNTATDILLDRVGRNAVNARLRACGLERTTVSMSCRQLLYDLVGLSGAADTAETRRLAAERLRNRDVDWDSRVYHDEQANMTTPREMGTLLELVVRPTLADATAGAGGGPLPADARHHAAPAGARSSPPAPAARGGDGAQDRVDRTREQRRGHPLRAGGPLRGRRLRQLSRGRPQGAPRDRPGGAGDLRRARGLGRGRSMDVFEAVRTVLAVRRYQERRVPPDVVRRIVEAGRLTASSMNGQPWHFIIVEDRDTLRRLGALAHTGPYVAQAPLAIVVAIEKTRFAVSDASRAIQSMVLTAWSEGVGSNWVGFLGLTGVKPLLGIPEPLDVLAIVPFGYPARTVGRGKKQRKALSEVAYLERFGRPFA